MSTGTDAIRAEQTGSFASSSTEAGILEDREKLGTFDNLENDASKQMSSDDMALGEVEREDDMLLLRVDGETVSPKSSFGSAVVWMVVNTLATVGIA